MSVDEILACPSCQYSPLEKSVGNYSCSSCGATYPERNGVPVLLRPDTQIVAEEASRAEFWNAGWDKRNRSLLDLDHEGILMERSNYLAYLTNAGYPSAMDLSEQNVSGKSFLNIGCGGGYEGLLFAGYGTRYIGVDFSHNAVRFTKQLIINAGFKADTFQCEAEALPFQDASVDVVYSSGVLHHTPNTQDTLKEVLRVLKPGGKAMIGLYATYSPMFMWYRLHAILRGNWTKKSMDDWMNTNTEGEWKTKDRANQWTKTYSKPEFIGMMERAGFSDIRIQQMPQLLESLPILGKLARALLPARVGKIKLGRVGPMLIVTCTRK